jgi:superfamily I DNA/RNA helicase/mRNA-degrading endonuclease RelE of RelBE toxin-antitoxin system
MSDWQTVQKSAYLADFVELNKEQQKAVVKAVAELEKDPIMPRGNTIKKLQGYENVWRYRLGDFRLIYAVAPEVHLIRLLAVGPRGSIYERFNFPGWDAPETAVEFGPELAASPDWLDHPEWFRPPPPKLEKLPRKLTPSLLQKWRIDAAYHGPLLGCVYADDLLNLPENCVPATVIERVMDGLFPAEVERIAAQPDLVLADPDDLLAYAEGDLAGFLLKLDEQQETLTQWALSGPTLVKGGPGSGKSTVALYRLRAIIEGALADGQKLPRVLFTTYTNALINVSTSLLQKLLGDVLNLRPSQALPPEIKVTTLHKIARRIARQAAPELKIAVQKQQLEALEHSRLALTALSPGSPTGYIGAVMKRLGDDYLLAEFEWVIEGQDCRNEEAYLAADRSGRGISLSPGARQIVWRLYINYRAHLLAQSHYSFANLIQMALNEIQAGHFMERWDYVIVDEAQDLTPAALALAVELCREPTGLFLTADANQSIYNRGFSWGKVHKDLQVTGRTRILRRNYRSTRQIAAAAAQILRPLIGADTEAVEQEFVHAGRRPVCYSALGAEDQARWIARVVYNAARDMRLPVNAAAVLVRSSSVGQPLAQALIAQGLPSRYMTSSQFNLADPAVKVTTLHAAKGLEFPIVVIGHVEAGRLPQEGPKSDPDEEAAHLAEERRLFYVGCTRAMRYLFITYDHQLPSPFLSDLTDDLWRLDTRDIGAPHPMDEQLALQRLILRGESDRLEFKSSFQVNTTTGEKDTFLRDMIVKSVAAFLNSRGGTLLVGIEDDGSIFGIERDLACINGKSLDQFELSLTRYITDKIGTEFTDFFSVHFVSINQKTVCVIEVQEAPKPNYVDGEKFFVRSGNATRELPISEGVEYINSHWRNRQG